jgi:hypothetical protein
MATTAFKSNIASDNFRLARSKILSEKTDGTYSIIDIPRYAFVCDVWLYITQAYAGGGVDGTATIGFTGNGETADPDGFMDIAACSATITGYKRASDDSQPASLGKWFNSGRGTITITLADNTCTTLMKGYVFVQYSVVY